MKDNLSVERLRQAVSYDKKTGIFTARIRRGKILPGSILGTVVERGMIKFAIDGEEYRAHRLAWLYVYGRWPQEDIDHKNGNPSDNRICNLREATDSQNLGNMKRPVTNKSGRKGVSWHKKAKKWQSHIKVEGRNFYLGIFDDIEAAHAAYANAAILHRKEFARY